MSNYPVINKPQGNTLKVSVPQGWLTTIAAISRKNYQQLLRVRLSPNGTTMKFGSKHGEYNVNMTDDSNGDDSLVIVPQRGDLDILFSFFRSENRTARLQTSPAYASVGLDCLEVKKPIHSNANIPDYVTLLIFVEDQNDEPKKYDDAVITVNFVKGVAP